MNKVPTILLILVWINIAAVVVLFVLHQIFPDNFSLFYGSCLSLLSLMCFGLIIWGASSGSTSPTVHQHSQTVIVKKLDTFNETPSGTFSYVGTSEFSDEYHRYIEENAVRIERFKKPFGKKNEIILANKYLMITFDIKSFMYGNGFIAVADKLICKEKYLGLSFARTNSVLSQGEQQYNFFKYICDNFDYETTAEDFWALLDKENIQYYEFKSEKKIKNIYDVNQMSEAELTALPGVTIAKAKHAIKVRREQGKFLTMNKFYQAIDLEEEFIEQIPLKGNKIIYNQLPEFKALEMKREDR